jgi:lipopolysaccharide export system protein LptA
MISATISVLRPLLKYCQKFLVFGVLLYCFTPVPVDGQRRVEWIYSEYVEYDQAVYGRVRRAIGSVQFKHEGTYLSCDSAYFFEETNRVEAYSNVHVKDSDTLNLFCDFLEYMPSTRIATARRNVVLVDPQVSLTTDMLVYDLKNNTAYYTTGGEIVSRTNTLTSTKGHYFANTKLFVFEQEVVLNHPRFIMTTDTLHYHTITEVAHVFGPTNIEGEENDIYTEQGIYDTKKDLAWLWQNTWLLNKDTRLAGDSLYYDRNLAFARGFRNVTIRDTIGQYVLGGEYGEYDEHTGYSFLTDQAWGVFIDAGDSLSLHADTLFLTFDTLLNGKHFMAYYGVRFYREDLQGVCDSLIYSFADSVIVMYDNPAIWFGKTQVFADTISLMFLNKRLHRMEMDGWGFIISDDLDAQYNQIRGRGMTAWFEEDELRVMFVHANTETLYYVRDDDELLIGIDKAISDRLRIEFEGGEVVVITYLTAVSGTTYPETEVTGDARFLKGFLLRTQERPLDRADIFRKE